MAVPEIIEAAPATPRPERPLCRSVVPPDPDRPDQLAFFEWELRGEEWSDHHLHDEFAYVLEGELHVTVDGNTVVAGPGALVRVPAGARGAYAAPVYAKLFGVYGPRPAGEHDARGALRRLPEGS